MRWLQLPKVRQLLSAPADADADGSDVNGGNLRVTLQGHASRKHLHDVEELLASLGSDGGRGRRSHKRGAAATLQRVRTALQEQRFSEQRLIRLVDPKNTGQWWVGWVSGATAAQPRPRKHADKLCGGAAGVEDRGQLTGSHSLAS